MPTLEEKKQKLELQIEQKKARLNKLNQQLRTQLRRERTRRLIQHGALAEKYLRCPDADTEYFEKLLTQIVAIPQVSTLLPDAEQGDTKQA
jgi:hypothetical protein